MGVRHLLKNLWSYRQSKSKFGIVINTPAELREASSMLLDDLHGSPATYEKAIELIVRLAYHYKERIDINGDSYADDFHNCLDMVRLSKFLELKRRAEANHE